MAGRARLTPARRRLAERHLALADRMARSRWRRAPWIDRQDLIGAARYGLCLAAKWWKRRAPFEALARQVVDVELGREVARWRWAGGRGVQLDDAYAEAIAVLPPGEDDEATITAFAMLIPRDQEVLTRVVIQGQSEREAAAAMGMPRHSLAGAKRTAMGRFRRLRSALRPP